MQSDYKDLALGIITALLGLLCYFVIIPIGVTVPESVPFLASSPAFWPNVISIGLIVIGCLHTGQTVAKLRKRSTQRTDNQPDENEEGSQYTAPVAFLRVIGAMLILVIYYVAMHWIGIFITSIIAFFCLSYLYGERRLVLMAVIVIPLAWAVSYLLTDIAHIVVPTGVFPRGWINPLHWFR